MKKSLRVVLYVRVSDPPKKQKDGSYASRQDGENQARQMRERVDKEKENGWTLLREYRDEETASGKKDRPQFLQLLADAQAGQFDLVIFWSLDRFSREGVLETFRYLETLTQAGVGWLSHTEEFLNSLGPFRDGVLAILACIAKQERIRISERVKAALDRRKAEGKPVGGRPKGIDWNQFERACRVGFSTQELCQMFDISTNWVRLKRRKILGASFSAPQPIGKSDPGPQSLGTESRSPAPGTKVSFRSVF